MAKSVSFAGVNSVFTSRISCLFAQKKHEEIRERISTSMNYILFIGIALCFGLIGISERFVPLFFGSGYEKTVVLLQYMSPLIVIVGISNCLGSQYYNPAGLRAKSAKYIITGSVVNLILNLVLIPIWKSTGAVIATLVAEATISALYLHSCSECYKLTQLIEHTWKKLVAGLVMLCVILIVEKAIYNSFVVMAVKVVIGSTTYFKLCLQLKMTSCGVLLFCMSRFYLKKCKESLDSIKDIESVIDNGVLKMVLPIKIQLPEVFFAEETRNDYLITYEMKKVWAVELDLLMEFDRVAQKLGVSYFIDSGTLLGAVRNGGFIPWDNDIDVVMFRDEYEVMIASYSEFEEPYFLQSYLTEPMYNRPHAQLRNSKTTGSLLYEGIKTKINQGIFMDIFVLDGLIQNTKELKQQIKKINRLRFEIACMYGPYSNNPIKRVAKKLLGDMYSLKYKSYKDWYLQLDFAMKKYTDTGYVDKIGYRRSPNCMHPLKIDWFSSSKEVSFEGLTVPIPIGFDKILREYFGKDYMVPQKSPDDHGPVFFDPEKPYTEYFGKNS